MIQNIDNYGEVRMRRDLAAAFALLPLETEPPRWLTVTPASEPWIAPGTYRAA